MAHHRDIFRRIYETGVIASAGIGNVLYPYPPGYVTSDHFWLVYEKEIRTLLRQLLNPGAIFIDIGAHRGFHSAFALGLVGPKGMVVACEPLEENIEGLRWLRQLNSSTSLLIEPSAISASTGKATLYISDDDGWNTLVGEYREHYSAPFSRVPRSRTVSTLSLDDLFVKYSHIGLGDASRRIVIKVDTEASEFDILFTSRLALAQVGVRAMIIVCSGGSSPFNERAISCVQILREYGFRTDVITPVEVRPWTPEDARRQVNILAIRN